MKYYELEPEDNHFHSVVADITHKCNMNCANCYIPNRDIPDIDLFRLYDAIIRLPKRTWIRLIGAEPTMHPDLPEIIKTILGYGHRVSLTTNGLKLASPAYLDSLVGAGAYYFLISMNGADDDEVYKELDSGPYAGLKVKALENVLKRSLTVNTGTIIAKGVNEITLQRQPELVVEVAKKAGIRFDQNPWKRITPVLRIKSVGEIGRNMGGSRTYQMEEMIDMCKNVFGKKSNDFLKVESGLNLLKHGDGPSYTFDLDTDVGKIHIRLIDWAVDEDGVVDAGNKNRGRFTEDFKIAPFFEHVKENEFGY